MGSTPIRLEAENATLLGNASRSSDTDPSTPWSNAGYVEALSLVRELILPTQII